MTELEKTNLKKSVSMVKEFIDAVNVDHDPELLQKKQQADKGLQQVGRMSEMEPKGTGIICHVDTQSLCSSSVLSQNP